jgi:hypothetical protein
VYAYNDQVVRLWAPSTDPGNTATSNGATVMVGNGWGNEINAQSVSSGVLVRVQAWIARITGNDFADIRVQVTNTMEPPMMAAPTYYIPTTSGLNSIVAIFAPTDDDAGSRFTYSIVAGDPDGIFALRSDSGVLTVKQNLVTYPQSAPVVSRDCRRCFSYVCFC